MTGFKKNNVWSRYINPKKYISARHMCHPQINDSCGFGITACECSHHGRISAQCTYNRFFVALFYIMNSVIVYYKLQEALFEFYAHNNLGNW